MYRRRSWLDRWFGSGRQQGRFDGGTSPQKSYLQYQVRVDGKYEIFQFKQNIGYSFEDRVTPKRRKWTREIMIRTVIRRSYYQWSKPRFASIIENGSMAITGKQEARSVVSSTGNSQLSVLVDKNFSNLEFAFGYGSGVLKQSGYSKDDVPQIDLIFGTGGDVSAWHDENLSRNSQHYSGLKYFGGSKMILLVQGMGAGIYFNPYVPIDGSMIKYGVSSLDNIVKDLCEWSSLYLAGRLQKPVKVLVKNEAIEAANDFNLQLAIHLGVLLEGIRSPSPRSSRTAGLFETITSLSYIGDFRMIIGGENPNKIKNIVSKQYENFYNLYEPYLTELYQDNVINYKSGEITLSEEDKLNAIQSLPKNFQNTFYNNLNSVNYGDSNFLHNRLIYTIKSIVRYPSIIQMIKGLLTAGAVKSIKYAWEKKKKNMNR